MLRLKRLEMEGFGPFADRQMIEFPPGPGVTVVYGENMRGKTSLLNAIRYAFLGNVLGRGSQERRLHTISNRELATEGRFGFSVALSFEYDGTSYELVRECVPRTAAPTADHDYEQRVMLRQGGNALGPQQRDRALQQVFPKEVSRFFLFDGELLQEYEELLISDSAAGRAISDAIERILGVPILKRGRVHLSRLSENADKAAAKEASKNQATQALGNALQTATEQREAHQGELARLQEQLEELVAQRGEAEQFLQSREKFATILHERADAELRLEQAEKDERLARADLQAAMGSAWRALLREPVKAARSAAQAATEKALDGLSLALRAKSIEVGRCVTCEREIDGTLGAQLQTSLPAGAVDLVGAATSAVARVADLNKFSEADNAAEIARLWKGLQKLQIEQVTLRGSIVDLTEKLANSDPEAIRRSQASFADVLAKITVVKQAIEAATAKVAEMDQSVQNLKRTLAASGSRDLHATQVKAEILRQAAEVFAAAVESYKTVLRTRVEHTASEFFRSMTTEQTDYAGLTISESYGLTIRHRDGHAEEARSAGAEHVVALALMGALQNNAPLRGPIVMDSPFGRLDEKHTSNVIETLPKMAEQVILLVYEAEVGKKRMRDLLANRLVREYELVHVSARRTNIREVK